MTHKPGPWMALSPAEWLGADGQWIVPGVAMCGNGELSEGNARLIAAAPELYEALVALVHHTDGVLPNEGRTKAIFAAAYAALDKAVSK